MKEVPDSWPHKAYKNLEFLNSSEARKIRVLCELTEPERRFRQLNVKDTIVVFGSARSMPVDQAKAELKALEDRIRSEPGDEREDELALARAKAMVKAAPYYEATRELCRELTKWSKSIKDHKRRFLICSGGGPGMMAAANQGAGDASGVSVGLGISLPFEQSLNPYITRDLQFEFHYFFVRKYWFMYLAKAMVAMPGGFGTMDELFEVLTLIQTRKVLKKLPIVLFGSAFWDSVINFDAFLDFGMICKADLDLFRKVDTVAEARDYLIEELTREYLDK